MPEIRASNIGVNQSFDYLDVRNSKASLDSIISATDMSNGINSVTSSKQKSNHMPNIMNKNRHIYMSDMNHYSLEKMENPIDKTIESTSFRKGKMEFIMPAQVTQD